MAMSCMTLSVTKRRPTLTQTVMAKTEIITDITCKFKGKLIAMEVKVDPGSETNCIPLSHFRRLFLSYAVRMAHPRRMPWNQLWLSLKCMMVVS